MQHKAPPPSSGLSLASLPISELYPKLWFKAIPEPARFMTAAGIGNIIFFYIDVMLYDLVIHPLSISNYDKNTQNKVLKMVYSLLPSQKFLQRNKETLSFFISYLIQILAQHVLNAFFVYGWETISTKDRYIATLIVTYSSYFISLVGSTICNLFLLRRGMSKNIAFWGTVFGFGTLNFLVLKTLIGDKQKNDGDGNTNNSIKTLNNTRRVTKYRNNNNATKGKKNLRTTIASDRRRSSTFRNIVSGKLRGGSDNILYSAGQHLFGLNLKSQLDELLPSHYNNDPLMSFVKSIRVANDLESRSSSIRY